MATKNLVIFNGGISTEPEVNALIEKFGVPEPNAEIPYSEVEKVIGVDRKKSRWASVTTAWRNRLEREHNVLLEAVPGEGFRAMTPDDRIVYSGKKYKHGIKAITRALVVVQKTDLAQLIDENKRAATHISDAAFKARQVHIQAARAQKQLAEQSAALEQ